MHSYCFIIERVFLQQVTTLQASPPQIVHQLPAVTYVDGEKSAKNTMFNKAGIDETLFPKRIANFFLL